MSERLQSLLVAHGAMIFLAGLAAGFPFAFQILGHVELWPIPGTLEVEMPGDYRAWRMAHMEGILNGLLLIAVGSFGGRLRLSPRGGVWVARGLVVTGWSNVVASWLAPLAGVRGLAFTGLSWNSVVFLLFMVGVVTVLFAMVGVFRGAWANARAQRG